MATLKILVVDDEPGIRAGVERILRNFKVDFPFMDEMYDFAVLEAETGERGIEIIESEKPDIVLLETLEPPTMATSGRFGSCRALPSASISAPIRMPAQATGAYLAMPWVVASARWAVPKASLT